MREYHVRFRERFGVKLPLPTLPELKEIWNINETSNLTPNRMSGRDGLEGFLRKDIIQFVGWNLSFA